MAAGRSNLVGNFSQANSDYLESPRVSPLCSPFLFSLLLKAGRKDYEIGVMSPTQFCSNFIRFSYFFFLPSVCVTFLFFSPP